MSFPHHYTFSHAIPTLFNISHFRHVANYHTFSYVIAFFFPDVSYHSYRSKLFILTRKSPPFVLDWLLPHVDSLNFTFGSRSPVYSESTLLVHPLHSHSSFGLKNSKRLFKSKSTQRVPQKYIYTSVELPLPKYS